MRAYTPLIPEAWREVLRKVQTVCPEAIIGGGALRDLYNGAPIKDVDIFVRGRADIDSMISSLRAATSMNFERLDAVMQEYANSTADIEAVLDGPKLKSCSDEFCGWSCNCPSVQIIVCSVNSPALTADFREHQLQRFDIGICQIAFDGKGVHQTVDYSLDVMSKRIRVAEMQTDERRARSLLRVERIAEKYPGWKIGPHSMVIPNE